MNRDDSEGAFLAKLTFLFSMAINVFLAQSIIRRIFRFPDYHLGGSTDVDSIFDKYNPSAIVLSNIFDDAEIALLREAKRRGVKTIGFINTWDKLTARCAVRLLPERLVVYNTIVKEEAIRYADQKEETVIVCGVPQYDLYVNSKPASRDKLYDAFKLNPHKNLILFAPIGNFFGDSDWEAIDLLHWLIEEESGIPNSQLLVRFQPNDFIDEAELKARKWLRYDLPGIRYGSERGGDWDMTETDMERLRDELFHSSVLVSYASSIAIDAALMGKPVININFEIKQGGGARKRSKTPTFYYNTEHYGKALKTGGIKLVKSKEELANAINAYMENPNLDSEKRERLIKEQCYKTDGRSGVRIAETILNYSAQ